MSPDPDRSRLRSPPWLTVAAALALTGPPRQAQAPGQRPSTEEQRVAEAIERALQKHGPDVHRCFEQALADRLDAAGKVEVEVDVGAGGQVTGAKLLPQGAAICRPALATCVQASRQELEDRRGRSRAPRWCCRSPSRGRSTSS